MFDFTVHVKSIDRKSYFEILDGKENSVSRSINYHSICDLKNALRSLNRIASSKKAILIHNENHVTFTLGNSRYKISLILINTSIDALTLLFKLLTANLVDDRDSRKLRTKVSGQVSDFD